MGRRESGNREGESILCPLFVAFTENELRCRPHMPEAGATIIRYYDKRACEKQRKLFCEGAWKCCEHYRSWKHFQWEDDE